ncbi:MAG: ABC transporter ATP-binding protein [Rhodospirillaceae bacterium]|jgi:ABC-type multidrug transport system fused ATPase/permease subunit|nr:ABC transporter ATP-binding protein [Rhodospirillaceae bacterium]MBT3491965.1 ABC transporter ATP-binding protein [Rhodospirillaceae bacterium]MBT3780352.1 ABC transporter ATP-binding protein [Rhodospirillaceae bacterium]MBT3977493.1 ABC transporter ATP-binding protein [Rhodospirillaceae bacterium]MBT4169781.1 ABC transporter ATP-binding protein [Rhodospirillaceae bacterium]
MEKTIYGYVWRFSRQQQVTMTLMSAASLPFLYLFYEIPKTIINEAFQGIGVDFPLNLSEKLTFNVMGQDIPLLGPFEMSLDQVPYLFSLCALFLVLVGINQGFKYIINVYKGLTGERMLRRLRFELYGRVLRFPLPTFRKMSQGEIIPMITAEVEPLGGFIGDAFSLPAFQGGYLATILAFLFMQDWRMAAAAVALYPLQLWLIPKLQRKVNLLGKERVARVRRLSDKIGETVQGVQETHAHDTSNFVLTDFANQLFWIYGVRERIYRQKFVIKFLNNSIQQLGPFAFYSIGGYFVIQGDLEIGTVIAAIAAHKDLAAPWKELLNYYQMQADASIKYDQVVSQFGPAGMRGPDYQLIEPSNLSPLEGELTATNLTLNDDQDVAVVDGVSLRLALDKRYAIVGSGGSGKEELTLLLARLLDPDNGNLSLGGDDGAILSEAVTGRRITHVGAAAFVFAGTIADNLFLGLKHRPLVAAEMDGAAARHRDVYVDEARRSGNIEYDPDADWIDYAAAGVEDAAALCRAGAAALKRIGMDEEVYQFGLRGTVDPQSRADLAEAILRARAGLRTRMANDPALLELVEGFAGDAYNLNASIGENLMFGNPVGDAFDVEHLAEHPYVLDVLEQVGLTEQFLSVGFQVASTMVELFADLPADHELFQQFSFISADELPDIQALLQRSDRANLSALPDEDRARLMSLPFKLIPARHRLGLVDDDLQDKVLEARRYFASHLPDELRDAVEFFDADSYNASANIQDNILFGKVAYGQAQAVDRVGALISEVVEEQGLHEAVAEVGLNFEVGIAGSRLSTAQRQKLALARALLKRPDILILSESTTSLDSAAQAAIMEALLADFEGRCLIWSVQRASMAAGFDEILVMRQGRLMERGTYADLSQSNDYVKELLASE